MAEGSKGCKKAGRMKKKCERYKTKLTREKNKVKKIIKHLKSHPASECALAALRRMNTRHPGVAVKTLVDPLALRCKEARAKA